MKVVTVVGTRPEIIRLSRVIAALDRHVEHLLVHTGQNYDYELNQVFFEDLAIRQPDFFLEAAGADGGRDHRPGDRARRRRPAANVPGRRRSSWGTRTVASPRWRRSA